MNVTTDAETPSYTTTTLKSPPGRHDYLFVVGFFLTTIFLFTITYVYHICKRSRSPPPSDTNEDAHNRHLIRLSRGLDEDVLVTFPTSVYSETKVPHTGTVANGSGCSICLGDYMPADVVRMLPECGHLFHVGCIDTWLKAHPTCPMCRTSPLGVST
ncbi:putative transcription factor C2H2 family [Helianthus annuus]|nr:putative transcription factor C2H2 family [Helianthus annuus]